MKELKDLTVGDPVMVVEKHAGPHRETISRLGRKYLFVTRYTREKGYDRETGREQGDNSYSSVETLESFDLRHRALIAEKELNAFGIELSYRHPGRSPEKIIAIRAALDVLMSSWVGKS